MTNETGTWERQGPLTKRISDRRTLTVTYDPSVATTVFWAVATTDGMAVRGAATSEESAKAKAERAAELIAELDALGAFRIVEPSRPERDVNMADANGYCPMCDGLPNPECYHPLAEVRDAFALVMRIPRAR